MYSVFRLKVVINLNNVVGKSLNRLNYWNPAVTLEEKSYQPLPFIEHIIDFALFFTGTGFIEMTRTVT
jgi:hypothetical protein